MRSIIALLSLIAVAGCGSGSLQRDGGGGGAGGGNASACQAVVALDRSCAGDSDCFAARHASDCCGNSVVIGLRTSEQARYQALEPACAASYPACGCPAGLPTTDDGSTLRFDATAGVACRAGMCTTFVPECGQPCTGGRVCFSCANLNGTFAACTTPCTDTAASSDCPDPALPLCQQGSSGNAFGTFCTAAGVACDTR
jgi:hypothetical protein